MGSSEGATPATVWYRTCITEHYREYEWRGSNANNDRRRELVDKSREVSDEKSSDSFILDDGTGVVTIDANDADVDKPHQVMNRRVQDDDGWGGRFRISVGSIILGGSGEGTTGYQQREWVVPVDSQVFVIGEARKDGAGLRLGKPHDGKSPFIVSTRTEEQLRKSAGTTATAMKVGVAVATVAGITCVVIGLAS